MKREYYFDYLRAVATFAVILWHSVSPVYYLFGPLREWGAANILFGFVIRWSVPVFYMISGALLLDRIEPIPQFYKRRMLRICIPLLTWTVIYGLMRLYYFKVYEYNHQPAPSFFQFVIIDHFRALLFDSLSYHLYFISIILGLYLIAPFLARMLKGLSQRQLAAFVCIGVGIYSLKFFFSGLIVADHFELGGSFFYFVLGFYLHKYPPARNWRRVIYLVAVLSAVLMTWLNYDKEYLHGGHQDSWYLTIGFFVYAISIAIFIWFRRITAKSHEAPRDPFRKALIFISSCSYGLFIAHPLVISFLLNCTGFLTFKTDKAVVTTTHYRLTFLMNNAWGAVVQALLVMFLLLIFFFVTKKLRLWRILT